MKFHEETRSKDREELMPGRAARYLMQFIPPDPEFVTGCQPAYLNPRIVMEQIQVINQAELVLETYQYLSSSFQNRWSVEFEEPSKSNGIKNSVERRQLEAILMHSRFAAIR